MSEDITSQDETSEHSSPSEHSAERGSHHPHPEHRSDSDSRERGGRRDRRASRDERPNDRHDHPGFGGGRRGGPGFEGRGGLGGPGGHRGHRGRRGDIRAALLLVLRDQPAHGYELIQAIAERSEGAWKPSPGSVYPTLQLLEEEGLLRSVDSDGKRVFELTEIGRTTADERSGNAEARLPWDRDEEGSSEGELRRNLHALMGATKQVGSVGTSTQVEKASEILKAARKSIYQLLAED